MNCMVVGIFGLKNRCSIIFISVIVSMSCVTVAYVDYVVVFFFLEPMKLKIQVCLSNARIFLVSPNSLLFVIK